MRGRTVVLVAVGLFGLAGAHHTRGPRDTLRATDVAAPAVSAQSSPDPVMFQQILHNYRTGRSQQAAKDLASWSVGRLTATATAMASASTLSPSDRMAAAILEAEVARAWLVLFRGEDALAVINSALALLHTAGPTPFGERLGEEPQRRWYYAVAGTLVRYYRLPWASSLVEIGLKEFRDDPLLITVRGTISDRRLDQPVVINGPEPVIQQAQAAAIADYRRALTLSPDLAIAKLRLGQLYVARGNDREASPWLQSVAAGPATDNEHYLAHLLLGRVAEHDHVLDTAETEYRKAYGIGPGYQAACIGLSHVEQLLEQRERAADIAADCLRMSEHDDPWPDYRGKDDPDALLHLRTEAHEP